MKRIIVLTFLFTLTIIVPVALSYPLSWILPSWPCTGDSSGFHIFDPNSSMLCDHKGYIFTLILLGILSAIPGVAYACKIFNPETFEILED